MDELPENSCSRAKGDDGWFPRLATWFASDTSRARDGSGGGEVNGISPGGVSPDSTADGGAGGGGGDGD